MCVYTCEQVCIDVCIPCIVHVFIDMYVCVCVCAHACTKVLKLFKIVKSANGVSLIPTLCYCCIFLSL